VTGFIDVINKVPTINERSPGIIITEKFDMPDIFIAVTSSLFFIFKKNQIPDIKIIKGNISYNSEGTISDDKKIGIYIPTSISLKRFISSNKVIINPRQKKIKTTFIRILENSLAIYLFITNDLIIIVKINSHI